MSSPVGAATLGVLSVAACTPVAVESWSADGGRGRDVALVSLADASGAGGDSGAGDGAGVALQRLINFQPPGASPEGADPDLGDPYDVRRGYGWGRDLGAQAERADLSPDPLLDTFIAAGGDGQRDTWELDLPDGRYLVTLAAGSPARDSPPMRIEAEGALLAEAETALRGQPLWSVDRAVNVRDGRLTLELGDGADSVWLTHVRVRQADAIGGCAARAEVCNQRDDDCDGAEDEEAVCALTPVCVSSTLESSLTVSTDGWVRRGGDFRDGGFAVSLPGDRLERTLRGNFYQGTARFEVKGLLWQRGGGAGSCRHSVLDLNRGRSRDPATSQLSLARTVPACGGATGGTLRATLHSAFCCLDSAPLPVSDDGAWHQVELSWDQALVRLRVDGALAAETSYSGPSVGRDPVLWLGSSDASGDASGATFRNFEICNQVTP